MENVAVRRGAGGLSLLVVIMATVVTLGVGTMIKSRCASGDWADGRQYRQFCYSDIVPLYATEHLSSARLPFLNACPLSAGEQCDEYPVLTMYLMRLAAWMGKGFFAFFYANAALLGLCALVTAWTLHRMAGGQALYFALAPTLAIYAFMNWDLLAVVLATLATFAYLRNRDGVSGALLGLGAAAKFYPALLLAPFVLGRLRERRRGGAASLVVGAAVSYAAVNLPFALEAPHAWATFFRFNSNRPADWDSIWFVACQRLHGGTGCPWSAHLVDELSLGLFIAGAAVVFLLRRARRPDFPRWTFGFPLLAAFLLTNKVYSPQYGLWLLPWFALALPNPWLFAAFEATEVAVFVTRFSWFGRLSIPGYQGVPIGAFQIALVARAAVLLLCVVAWTRGREAEPVIAAAPTLEPSLSGTGA